LGDIVADGDGDLNTSCQFSNTATVGWDEDAKFEHSARLSTATIPIFYRSGLDTSNIWRSDETLSYPVLNDGLSDLASYNQLTGGSWQQTSCANRDFVLAHVAITNDIERPYVIFQGQSTYLDKKSARAGAPTEINYLITEGLPIVEFKFVATIIIETRDGYGNTPKSRIVTTDDGADYIDLRGSVIGRIGISATVSDHNALTNVNLATTGITYGHIDDQAQSLYGVKTFVNGIAFVDTGEAISGDGTDLTITSGNDINLTATNEIKLNTDTGNILTISGDDATTTLRSSNRLELANTLQILN